MKLEKQELIKLIANKINATASRHLKDTNTYYDVDVVSPARLVELLIDEGIIKIDKE
jgi:hypothetical protein